MVGDRLQLFVMEDPSFNQDLEVRERGDIIMAPFGRIPVAGLSVESAEKRIKDYLERDQLKKATVILDRVGRGKLPQGEKPDPIRDNSTKILVYMTDKVNRPGQHVITIPEGKSVGIYEAILITGGMDRFADERKVYVLRKDENNVQRKIPVNIRAIRQGSAEDPPIGHGDIVVVPERVFGN
ncbi:MAG: polysaccharide biosynthesis/export family protein [Verrucomicrobiae bacterium]|nr:polysaccharide biosynthesis/export family protein [Verrucomicrobiae bacterium]